MCRLLCFYWLLLLSYIDLHPKRGLPLLLCCSFQIRIAALNAASTAADESQDPLRSSKSQTKEAQVQTVMQMNHRY